MSPTMAGPIPLKTHIGSGPRTVNAVHTRITSSQLPAQRIFSGRRTGLVPFGPRCSLHWTSQKGLNPHLPTVATASAAASGTPVSPPAENGAAGQPVPADKNRSSVRLALEILWPDRFLVALTALTLILTVGLTLAFPLAIGDLFDVVRENLSTTVVAGAGTTSAGLAGLTQTIADVQSIAANAPPQFYPVLFRLCACLMLSAMGNAAVAYLAPLLGERFAVRLRKRLMAETLAKDQAFFDSAGKGDIVSLLTLDVAVIQNTLADFLGQRGIRSMLEVFCSLAIIATKNPLLALVSFLVTPALSVLLRQVVQRSAKLTYARQQAAARAMEFATERLTHVRTVQLFAAEDREAASYGSLTQAGYAMAQRCATFQGIVEGAGRLAVNVGTLSLLGLGGALVLAGRISLGTLLAFNVYNLFLSVGLSALAGSLGEMGKAVGAMERIAEIVDASGKDPAAGLLNQQEQEQGNHSLEKKNLFESSTTISSSSTAGTDTGTTSDNNGDGVKFSHHLEGASAELRDVWFKYQGREDWALQGMTLSISPGSTVALVGPSGGGKSTTAALLLGLYSPQQGAVLIDGVELTPDTIPQARSLIGTVLQQPSLMSGTVREDIAMGRPDATHEDIIAAASAAHAAGFIADLPLGYDTELGERGHQLSGGQQQRLSIARALVRQPRLLLLDEPTAALDVDAERAVDEALSEVEGCTKIIIAHRLSTVRRSDLIAVVVGGAVVEQGSHDALMAIPGGHYQRMVLNSELGGEFDDGNKQELAPAAEVMSS